MPDVSPLCRLLATIAGCVHREQAATITYLAEENRVLKEQLRGRRLVEGVVHQRPGGLLKHYHRAA